METLVHHGQKVSQLYDAFNRGDIETILNNLSNDCIWEVMGQPDIPFSGIYHGREDIKEFFGKLANTLQITEMTPEHILENGNLVIATGHYTAMALNTNKRFSSSWAMMYEFNEEGQCTHFRDCFDTLACMRAMSN
ncbi:nuclear transport factor 2 family protein [Longitalea luteola]|uniref:nuclear transport factor 2 family protein n=1 Tax=Longitalea luteola TaxID=2812563 RepID=UPI001A978195|nr:nuclear transport factor 2 family protein [Longitalea luteola]